ncbi:MAG: hypothetical protein ACUVUC_13620 [Thermoguttaceae bacterium]
MRAFTESTVEEAALAWLEAIGWQLAHGPDIAPDMPSAERAEYGAVLLGWLRDARQQEGHCGQDTASDECRSNISGKHRLALSSRGW